MHLLGATGRPFGDSMGSAALGGESSTHGNPIDPKTYTLNPKTYTLNPKTYTLNPKPYTLNPKPMFRSVYVQGLGGL